VFSVQRLRGTALSAALENGLLTVTPVAPDSFGTAVFRLRAFPASSPDLADSLDVPFTRRIGYRPPQPFALTFPAADAELDTVRFTFRWAPARITEGLRPSYTLRIQPQTGGAILIRGLSEPFYALDGTEGLQKNEAYTWWVTVSDGVNTVESITRNRFVIGIPVANESENMIPLKTALLPAYPNPFNPSVTIAFNVHQPSKIEMAIFDLNGRKVRTLIDGFRPAGTHRQVFDAANLASGIYLVQLRAGNFVSTQRITLLK
jgi:hypothetical protein